MTAWPSLAGCVLFSQIAYLEDGDATDRLGRLGFTGVQCFDSIETDTRCFIARGDQFDLAGFKGTSSIRDMLIDAQIIQTEWYDSRVHSGFLSAYGSVRDRIVVNEGDKPILVVGHSLGGGLATLYASDMVHQGYGRQVSCVTFGSPRVGDDAFVAQYNKMAIETTRVVHHYDIVPRVPNINYHHVDGLLHLLDDGTATSDARNWFRNLFGFNRMMREEARYLLADVDGQALQDHKLANYASSVSLYLQKELHNVA